jgi:hypothetical protein
MALPTSLLVNVSALAAAALLGYAAHRASLCNVKAVLEVLGSGSGFMLASFAKAALWATMIYGTLIVLSPSLSVGFQTYEPRSLVLLGGFIFGIGAAINGGCSLSTLQRLADGDLGMTLTLLGLGVGLLAWSTFDWQFAIAHAIRVPLIWRSMGHVAIAAVMLLWLLAALEVWRLWRTRPKISFWRLPASKVYRLSTAAMVIGTLGGLLNILLGSWTYTYYLRNAIYAAQRGTELPREFLALLSAALIVGMIASAVQRRSFKLRWSGKREAWKRVAGGMVMGFGGALIPGGNDTIVLTGIPTLSGVALATYMALLLGIAAALVVMRAVGAKLPMIECSGDACTSR